LNFVGKFDAKLHIDGSGVHPAVHHHVDSISTHAPSDAIIVADADLLFKGEFKRSGVDLIVSRDDHELVVPDYFKGEKRAALASPDGARLNGEIVNALAGHAEYAQADGAAGAGKVIGHVTKLVGTATAIRNGVSIILNHGDNVEKGDVVQSGSVSTLGVTFIDGTVFGLSSNARMVLNEMVYDPNGSDNSSLISLVSGTISFVAGQTAKHGDMKIDTPVATMGIRGTAVLVEIDFDVPGGNGTPAAKFQVLMEPDGTTGSYILFDKNTLAPIAIVDKAGQRVDISNNNVSVSDSSFTPELQKLITDVFALKFSQANPQNFTHFTDTLTPQETWLPVQFANGGPPSVVHVTITPVVSLSETSSGPAGPAPTPHIDQAPQVTTVDNSFTERLHLTGSSATDITLGTISFADINLGDRPTAKATFSSFSYQNAHHQDITASAQELKDIQTLEKIPVVMVQAPGNTNTGTAAWTLNIPDKDLDFLGAGDTLTLTYMAEVDSNYAAGNLATLVPFTVTITGTNDVPVITTAAEKVAFFNVGTSTPGPSLPPPTGPTTNTLAFKDPDLTDTHTVSTELTAATLSESGGQQLDMQALETKFPRPMDVFDSALTAAVTTDSTGTGAGTVTWTLADISAYYADIVPVGETLTLTYTVTVKDSQGATSSQNVTVTITGSESAAVVWVETAAEALTDAAPGDWNGAHNWETGAVPLATDDVDIITDQLQGPTPFYPVTIKAGATASAHSVTMDNFEDLANAPGATAPELDVGTATVPDGVTNGSLTIGTEISLSADSILKVFGTLSVGTIATILGNSVLQNSGLITLGQGGEFGGSSSITNSGTIELLGGSLDVEVAVANSGGIIRVDPGATLELNGAAIDGGTITDNGTIDVTGDSKIDSGATLKNGAVTVESGVTLTLDGMTVNGTTITDNGTIVLDDTVQLTGGASLEGVSALALGTITNSGTLEVAGAAELLNITLTNTGGIIQVDDSQTLTLSGTEIIGGTINDFSSEVGGKIDVTGDSRIDSGATLKNGAVTVESGVTLTLDGMTVSGTTIIDKGTIVLDDTVQLTGGASLEGVSALALGAITNNGTLEVTGAAELLNVTVTNTGGVILIDGTATLDDVTIAGGTITNSGSTLTIDSSQALTLQGGASLVGGTLNISGTLYVESSSGATLDGVTVTGSGGIQVDVIASPATPTLVLDDGTAITGGTLTVGPFGTLAVETADGATLNGVGVTNENSIEVFAGSVLILDQVTTVDNSTGAIAIDGTAMLTLNDASISGGTVTNNGRLTLEGKTALKDGTLLNFGQINVSGTVNELDNEQVTNASAVAILALGVLTLDHLTTVDNTGGIITVYGTATLALNDATISGGTINDYSAAPSPPGGIVAGEIDVTGSSTISGAGLNHGQVTIESGVTLTLDNDTVTGTHFTDTAAGAIIQVDGGTTLKLSGVTIDGGTINDYSAAPSPPGGIVAGEIDVTGSSTISGASLNHGQITIESGVVLTLDNDTVTGTYFTDTASGATIQVDGGTTLKLSGVTINGGIVNDFNIDGLGNTVAGDIDITGSSIISNASLNHGNVTVESGQKLTLDGDSVNGTAFTNIAAGSVIHVDGGDTLTLNDSTTITGGGVTIDAGALVKTSGDVTLTNTSVTNDGKIEVTDGILKITGSVGDGTPGGSGSIQIDNGAVLDLNASDTQNVAFSGSSGKLQIDTSSFGGSISGLTAGDQIDLSTVGYGLNTTGTYSNGVLTITDGTDSVSMTLTGDYSNAHFAGSSDGHGGTLITLNANDDVPAFASADKSESATVTELANTTGSSALDPSPPASGTLHFTDIDLTDRPTVTDIAQSVALTDATTTLSSSEIQALEHAFSLIQPANTNNGSLAWTYQISDSSLDFLSAGEKATVTSTITLDDHHGGTDTATVTVTVEGANDLPTIVAETDPSVQTVILNKSPIVLGAGASTNSLELPTETFDNLTAGSASNNGFGHGDFTSTALQATFTASGAAGIVHGSSSVTAAPFIGPLPGHADATNYLSIGAHASETISFGSEQNEFGLYWGSADSFNTISFYDGNNLVASYSGTDVAPLLANGNQGTFGSNGYVEFSDLAPFDKVVLASGSNAFEVDNISAGFVSDSHIHLASPIAGTLTVADADIGDTLTASVTGDAVAEYNGSTTLPSDVNVSALIDSSAITFDTVKTTGGQDVLDWTYNPANADLDFLEPGDKLTLTFNALVSDGHATTESQPLTVTLLGSNASVVNGTAQNDTFVNVGGGVKIFGNGGQDTFVFNKNFGSATIADFNVNNDSIEIDKSLFATVSALLQGAHSANSGHDTIITDAAHDQITLSGVTLAQLQAHPNDFHLI
jgi:fibronectin-binding autotransporter adhesin